MTEEQFDLFGDSGSSTDARLLAARPDEATANLTARMPGGLYLGTSSWSFPGWAGLVYAHTLSTQRLARAGLAAYAAFGPFRSVCIDRGYHAPVPVEDYQRYAQAVPEDFRFMAKAHAAVTQASLRDDGGWTSNRLFLDVTYATEEVVAPYVEGLGEKGGVLVFQFPPVSPDMRRKPQVFAERLQRFLEALPSGPRYAVEIRDAALLGPWFARAVRESGTHFCHSLHPRMPPITKQRDFMAAASRGPLIVRWNLHPTQTYEGARQRYAPFDRIVDEDPPTRMALTRLARETLAAGREVFIITNNKAEGSAPLTALALGHAIIKPLR